nr:YdaS family helix-turn-helix protein [uncultured Sphingomonas sp.]
MGMETTQDTPLAKAICAAGSQSAFGRWIGRRQSTVNWWLANAKPLPAEHVLLVERLSGISRSELRPDIYPSSDTPSRSSDRANAVAGDEDVVRGNRNTALPPVSSND